MELNSSPVDRDYPGTIYETIQFEDYFHREEIECMGIIVPVYRFRGNLRESLKVPVRTRILSIWDLEPFYGDILRRLPSDRRSRTLRFRQKSDRLRSAGAGLLIELVRRGSTGLEDDRPSVRDVPSSLSDRKERNHAEPALYKTEAGKPFFENGLHFNLAHSGDYVIMAESDRPVGVDLETERRMHASLRRILSEEEKVWIDSRKDSHKAFFVLWTRKESLVKCTGEGLGTKAVCDLPALAGNGFPYRYEDGHFCTKTFVTDEFVFSETVLLRED